MVVYLSYTVAGRADLAGLKQLILQFKPDYIFLQEMLGTKVTWMPTWEESMNVR